jgi:hypothetical protein
MVIDVGALVSSVMVGFGITMAAWFIVWGITKAISLFKGIVKV